MTTCPDCAAPIWRRSVWCRDCALMHKGEYPPKVCLDCNAPTFRAKSRCPGCAQKARRHTNVCVACSGPVSGRGVQRCRPCADGRGQAAQVCPECGGPKSAEAARCRKCDVRRRGKGLLDWHGIVMSFDPTAFRAEIERAPLEWSLSQLAAASGVGLQTIRHWLQGINKPTRVEYDAVMRTLAFEPCQACKGLGHVDPTRPRRVVVERKVQAPRPILKMAPPPSGPLHVGELTVDPGTRTMRLGSQVVELTRAETVLIVTLASQPDTLLTHRELAQLAGAASPEAANTHLNRAKVKLRQIGARGYLLSGKGSGNMLSSRIERDSERTA